jgi:cytochrome c biogenesis protein CcmG/thiol:disulfide interchange protein DsbE
MLEPGQQGQIIMSEIAQPPADQTTKDNKISLSGILIWVVVIGLLLIVGWGLLDSRVTRPEAGTEAPVFEMQFFDGYQWQDTPNASLGDMRGQVVVVNFWASWCVECRVEADLFEQTWRRYADQGVVFLGIAYADVEPNSIAYMKEFNLTYPHAPDLGTDISEMYEITGVPETFIIDKTGEIAHVQIGPIDAFTLDSILSQLVAEGG